MRNLKVYIETIAAIVIWGFSFLWSNKLILLGIPMEFFVFVRVLIAGALLLCVSLAMGFDIRIRKGDAWKFFCLGMCEPFLYFIFETYGIKFTESPTYSSLMIAMTPVFSVFAGMFLFKEKFTLLNALGVAVCLVGLVMVTMSADSIGEHFVLGLVLLLFAVFSSVGHASFAKTVTGGYSPIIIVMYQSIVGAALFLPLFLSRGLRSFDAQLYFSWDVVSPVLCLAVLCSVVAFIMWVDAIKNLGVAKSSIFQAMNPVVTAIAGTIIGQEVLNPLQWLGIMVAVVGVVFSQLGEFSIRRK